MIGLRSLTASGGIETMVKQVATRTARLGLDVTVYCRTKYNPGRPARAGDVRLANVPTIYTKHLETFVHTFLAVCAALGRGARVFHFQALGPSFFAFLPRLFGRKSVVTIHGLDWKRGKWGAFARSVLRMAEACAVYFPNRTVVCSKSLQRYIKRKYRRDAIYIPNAVEDAANTRLDRLAALGIEPGRYLLFLGRIVPEKGLHLLLDAFAHLETDIKLAVVGDAHHDKHYGQELIERARGRDGRPGDDRVVFTGALFGPEKEEALSNAYAFILPSFIEGMSIVLLEAMGHGICPLVSDIEENLEVIEPLEPDKPAGVPFRCGDVESLRRELANLLADPDRVRRIGRNAREKVHREYNWDAVAERYVQVYQEAMGVP